MLLVALSEDASLTYQDFPLDVVNSDLLPVNDLTTNLGSEEFRLLGVYASHLQVHDAEGYVKAVLSIPTHTGHGIIIRDTNTSTGRAPKIQFESASRTWQIVANNVENTVHGGFPDTVGQDFCVTQADAVDGQGYRLAIHGETGDLIVNPGLGTRDGRKDGVVRAGDRQANDAHPARSLTVRGGDAAAGTGNGGNLLMRGGTSFGGKRGSHYFPLTDGEPAFTPDTVSGYFAGPYLDPNTNLLYIHNGSNWLSCQLS